MNYAELLARWNALTMQTRILIGAGIAVVLIGIISSFFLMRDTRVMLFAKPLTADQVTEVDGQLSAWSVPFMTIDDNVRVEKNQRNELLLRLSMVGIPHQSIVDSSDALAKVGALTPQSVLDLQTRDAIANDLALALRNIEGIADAKVIIAPGKEAFFADDQSADASASVRITMQSGHTLTHDSVDGIRRFVANGVSGLKPEHVTVLDDRGFTLGEQAQVDQSQQNDIQSTVQSALDKAFGGGLSIVRVHADINKTAKQQYSYKNLPVGGGPITDTKVDERLAGKDRAYSKVHENAQNGNQGLATRSEIMPGGIERLSIAVFVDASLAQQIPEIRQLVAAAAGVDSSRGDRLSVQPVAMAHPAPPPMVVHSESIMLLGRALPGLIIGLVIIGILLVAIQPLSLVLRRNANRELLSHTKALEPGVDALSIWRTIGGEPAHVAAAVISQLPTSTAVAVLDMYPENERREITERLSRPIAPVLVDIVKVPSNA